MWYIAEWRWWRAKRYWNKAQDNNAILRMGIDEDVRDLICHKQTVYEKIEKCKRNGKSEY